ncbi:MAG: YggS family pyridoxal phosphate-dependent enzyme [Candidatus Sericytochromatia bacterium]|nr:YggS family pyridoxal phosphate-dependent enzyme [Candidatus Sericytochromatia bacterium]
MVLGFTVEENTKYFVSNTPDSVTLIGVTKTKGIDDIKRAVVAGIKNIGENKVQEALEKYQELKDLNLIWHFIGRLQTNKVKKAVEIFDLIHSVDRINLAEEIDKEAKKLGKKQKVLLQVNTSGEESKAGFSIDDLIELLPKIVQMNNLDIVGLMTVAPATEDENLLRKCFSSLRELKDKINESKYFTQELKILSMGMTGDYAIAIEEGSTMIRLGRAIFGERNY